MTTTRAGFADRLSSAPLLLDGAMGTSLVEAGIEATACFDVLNLRSPEVVEAAHRAYVAAGADALLTNTFGANRYNLARFGLADAVVEINRAGVRLARDSVEGRDVLVAGSVGPLRARLAPYGRVSKPQARDVFSEQVEVLAAAGCDLVVIETQSDPAEMLEALAAARETCGLPVVVTATFTTDDTTMLGATAAAVAAALAEAGADAVGVNCSQGPAQAVRLLRAMAATAPGLPLAAKPNAGGPGRTAGRILWPATPAYFAESVPELLDAGVRVFGGCCGTRPAHIASLAQALRLDGDGRRPAAPRPAVVAAAPSPGRPSPGASDVAREAAATGLAARLEAGAFVIAAEADPPRGGSMHRLLAGAETLGEAGVDVLNITGSSRARLRMSAWAPCRLIHERVGVETILTFPTRGRNMLRVQGDVLAAHALGIRNLFVVMGDPMAIGDYPDATDRVDVVPSGLIELVSKSFNSGLDQAGGDLGEATRFVVGCAVNPNAEDLRREARVLRRKIDAGADFALSQPVFSADRWTAFREVFESRHGPLRLPVLVGVQPLVSARHAAFLHNEVPGYDVPQTVRDAMEVAGESAGRVGREAAVDLAAALRQEAAGIYVYTPFGRFDLVAEIVEAVRSGDAATAGRA